MAEENRFKPFYSVLVLAFVCSALVAGAAVGLRDRQEANRLLDQKKNILYAADLYDKTVSVEELFQHIDTRIIELQTGKFVTRENVNPQTYNQIKAALDTRLSTPLEKKQDIAGLARIEKYSFVYLVKNDTGYEQIIVPVRGKGLWSTMYAYVALSGDLNTITGISFYEHGETPGLGGEIENSIWQQSWKGKQIYNSNNEVSLNLVKGKAQDTGADSIHQIDGLSGATLTAVGVNKLMEFWFGDHGFKPFFAQIKKGGLDG